jgi:hypothetical protein
LITCKRIRMTLSDAPAGVVEVVANLHTLVGREPGTINRPPSFLIGSSEIAGLAACSPQNVVQT